MNDNKFSTIKAKEANSSKASYVRPLSYEEMKQKAEEFLHTEGKTSYAGNVVWVYSYELDIPVMTIIDSDDNDFCAIYSTNHFFGADSYGDNGNLAMITAYGVDTYIGNRWYAYDISVSPEDVVASAKYYATH